MAETTAEIRRDIEMTRDRISGTINELEQRVNVVQQIRANPWPSLAVAFAAGLALSRSGADARAAAVTATATRETGSRLSTALDGVVASLVTGVTAAFQDRIDDAVTEIATAVRGSAHPRPAAAPASSPAGPPSQDPFHASAAPDGAWRASDASGSRAD